MAEDVIRQRCEQSDFVQILLNMAIIPDTVVRRIPNFGRGWQKEFLRLMEDYKKHDFKGDNFEFQNDHWEGRYKDFKDKQEQGD